MQPDKRRSRDPMTTKVSTAISIAAVSVIVACASPVVTYSGPRLPQTEVSILRIDVRGRILRIDDRYFNGRAFELIPGDHSVHFKFIVRGDEAHPGAHAEGAILFCDAVFRAEPGHYYQIVRTDPEQVSNSGTFSEVRRIHEFHVHLLDLGNEQGAEKSAVFCEWS